MNVAAIALISLAVSAITTVLTLRYLLRQTANDEADKPTLSAVVEARYDRLTLTHHNGPDLDAVSIEILPSNDVAVPSFAAGAGRRSPLGALRAGHSTSTRIDYRSIARIGDFNTRVDCAAGSQTWQIVVPVAVTGLRPHTKTMGDPQF